MMKVFYKEAVQLYCFLRHSLPVTQKKMLYSHEEICYTVGRKVLDQSRSLLHHFFVMWFTPINWKPKPNFQMVAE